MENYNTAWKSILSIWLEIKNNLLNWCAFKEQMGLFVLKFYCDFFFPLTQGSSNKSRRLLREEGPSPMFIFFFFFPRVELMQTQIRCDYSNCKYRRGRYARLEKKLLREIACAAEERESCLEYVVCQRCNLKMKYTFKHNLNSLCSCWRTLEEYYCNKLLYLILG